jgi:LPS-assembly protein
MTYRALLLAALVAAATAVPAAGDDATPAPEASEASLPPLLVRWPLAPRARAAAPAPAPAPVRPVPAPRIEPTLEPLPEPDRRPPAEPVAQQPVSPGVEPEASADLLERDGPASQPAGIREPLQPGLEPAERSAEQSPGWQKQPETGRDSGTREREVEFDVGGLLVPPAQLALSLGSFEVQPPTEALRRWTFPEESGLSWSALESAREGDWVILRGAVDVRVGADRIQADEVRLNERTDQLHAEGNVVLDHLDSRLAGERMEYDLTGNKGTVWNAIGFAPNDITFTGERVEKVGENKYVLYSGSFTSCTQPLPIWQVKVSKAIIDVDNFVYLFNPRVAFKKLPASWLPWAAIPIKQERTTGFMVPKISRSSTRGWSVSEDFFWAINRSMDVTIGGQWWEDYGWASDLLARWHLPGMSRPGQFEAIYVSANEAEEVGDRLLDSERWYASFEHDQEIWEDWKLTVKGEIGSDRLTQQQPFFDLEGNLGSPTPVFNQRVTLQRRWGKHSLSIAVENDERENEQAHGGGSLDIFDSGSVRRTTQTSRRLPEAEYRMSSTQIGGRRWAAFELQAIAGYLRASNPVDFEGDAAGTPLSVSGDEYDHDWFVLDANPKLSFPINNAFFEIVPTFNVRTTYWSKQQAEEAAKLILYPDGPIDEMTDPHVSVNNTATVDEDLFLWSWDAGVRVGGPDFQRIYRKAAQPGKKKWQHLIEPEVRFTYTPTIDDEYPIKQDRRANHYTGRMNKTGARASVSLINTLRNKEVVPVGEKAKPTRDWLIWRLSADYNFREKGRDSTFLVEDRPDPNDDVYRDEDSHWGDISSDVNFRPSDNIRFSLRNTFDILQDDFTRAQLTGGVEGQWGYVDLAYTLTRNTGTLESDTNELTMTGEHWFYKEGRIRLGYDFTKSFRGSVYDNAGNRTRSSWPYKRIVASYYNQCCGLSLSWEDVDDRSVEREKEWTFIISLKDVGNFARIRQRSK